MSQIVKVYASSYARSNDGEYNYQYQYNNGKQKTKGQLKVKGKIVMTINDTFFDENGKTYYAVTFYDYKKPNSNINLSVNLPKTKIISEIDLKNFIIKHSASLI